MSGIDWNDVETAYRELQKARKEGNTALLMRLTEMQGALSDALDAHVVQCHDDNMSWQAIGDAIGVTRQAASKRWSRLVDARTDAYWRGRRDQTERCESVRHATDVDQLDVETATRVATPTEISTARVAAKAAERLGYSHVGICQHCNRPVVIIISDDRAKPWRHRDDMRVPCRPGGATDVQHDDQGAPRVWP